MKILLIGCGGREHALARALLESPRTSTLFVAPGSDALAKIATCVDLSDKDVAGLLRFAKAEEIDLTVVGPEAPLVLGVADRFEAEGLRVFGPTAAAAALEGSKTFAKNILRKYRIPTAHFRGFDDPRAAVYWIEQENRFPLVIKADGLAAGKGVIIAEEMEVARGAVERIMVRREFGEAGSRIIVEEFLHGTEASMLAFTDGHTIIPLDAAIDHKAVFDGDVGPNTGGMGAYCPSPILAGELYDRVEAEILLPIVRAMNREGRPYRGILYAGLMLTDHGPKVLEFNVRFGDPEAQVILPRMRTDLVEIALKTCEGRLAELSSIEFLPDHALIVVLASEGYPGSPKVGREISGLEEAEKVEGVTLYHSGTCLVKGRWQTSGGRVLGVGAKGRDLAEARQRAYRAASLIRFQGMHYRRDIGVPRRSK